MNQTTMIKLKLNDGGRANAGFKGEADDCVCRAIAIAFNMDYKEVYSMIEAEASKERNSTRSKKSHPSKGVRPATLQKIIEGLGGIWKPLMGIGSGCKVHLRQDELPANGTYILRVSKHLCTYIDGVLHDNHDCSRNGSRCVYGYWEVKK